VGASRTPTQSAGAAAEVGRGDTAERYRSLVAAMTEGIVFFDAAGAILDCNPAAERILGLPRDVVLARSGGEPWATVRDDGSAMPIEEYPLTITLRTGQPVRGVVMGIDRPDGTRCWTLMNSEPLRRPGEPRPFGVVTSFEDVTESRAAAEAVRRREAQFRLALECAEHVFWEADFATGRVTSGAPWTIAGWAPDALDGSGAAFRALIHPDDRGTITDAFRAHLEGRAAQYHAQYRLRSASGDYRWIQARGRILRGHDGTPERVTGTVTDVTEERLLAERVRAADRLASIGTLAGGIAHEVNNPLACVVSNLAYLEEALARVTAGDGADASPAELRQAVREALDGATRVRGIIRGLRQFASPEAHAPRTRVDAAAQLAAGVDLARNELTHRARLTVDLAPDLPPVVAGDGELGQVLVNLLVNAGQAIPEGRVGENEIRVAARAEGHRVVIEVRDTGAGIRPEDRPRIFDPFFTTKPVGGGTGLGLSVVHGIVTTLGGRLEVESAAGAGALFRVILPAAPAESPPPPVREAAPRRGRVLIVDDDPLVGRSLARLLSGAHQVEALASPLEALRRIRAGETWDVVLCDLMMPELSGMELEARVQEAVPGLASRFVYLTGGAFTDSARAFLAGGRPYLEKPVDAMELRARVGERVRAVAG
jgi:PAS domain S-box-containing protein